MAKKKTAKKTTVSRNQGAAEKPSNNQEDSVSISKFQRRIQVVNRQQLVGAPYNPRYIDPAAKRKLRKSIEKHGLVQPPVWNVRTGNIVAAHKRLDEMDLLHGTNDYNLEVVVVDVSEKDEKEMNVALNNPGMQGFYDVEKLHELIQTTPNIDIHAMGFEVLDLELLYQDAGLSADKLDQFYSSDALSAIEHTAQAASDLLDESDAIEQEQKEREGVVLSGDGEGGSEETDLELIRERRQAYNDRVAAENEAAFYVTVVFRGDDDKTAFMKALELNPYQATMDGYFLAELLDITMPETTTTTEEPNNEESLETASTPEATTEPDRQLDEVPF